MGNGLSGMSLADVYGGPVGPGEDRPGVESAAPGLPASGTAPAISWVGILLVLVALRVLYEMAEEI